MAGDLDPTRPATDVAQLGPTVLPDAPATHEARAAATSAAVGRSATLTKTHAMHVLGLVLTVQLLVAMLNAGAHPIVPSAGAALMVML